VDKFISSNPQINRALYGKWVTILERDKRQQQIDQTHYMSKQSNLEQQLEVTQTETNKTSALDSPSQVKENEKISAKESQPAQSLVKPRPQYFNLPYNPEE
jgi:hypothetical protein